MNYQIVLDYTLAEGALRPFFETLREGRALAARCEGCGFTSFPPRMVCAECGSRAFAWRTLPGEAVVLARTDTGSSAFALVRFEGADGMSTVAVENPDVKSNRCRVVASGGDLPRLCVRLENNGEDRNA